MNDISPSSVHPTKLSIHTYPPQLNQPSALFLPPTLQELKLLSRSIALKAAFIPLLSSQLLEAQEAIHSSTHTHTHIYTHKHPYISIHMHACMYTNIGILSK